jgi:hypothetical protein
MSSTYLQDFGTLRRAMREREVNDPMSSAGRWDDLQLDIKPPHIPRDRRSPVPSNPTLVLAGEAYRLRASRVAEAAHALGFHSTGCYKHRLVTMKAETYRRSMQDAGRPEQTKLHVEREVKFRHDNIRAAIRSLVHKVRFSKSAGIPSVADVYRRHIKTLWAYRNI